MGVEEANGESSQYTHYKNLDYTTGVYLRTNCSPSWAKTILAIMAILALMHNPSLPR